MNQSEKSGKPSHKVSSPKPKSRERAEQVQLGKEEQKGDRHKLSQFPNIMREAVDKGRN